MNASFTDILKNTDIVESVVMSVVGVVVSVGLEGRYRRRWKRI